MIIFHDKMKQMIKIINFIK